MRLDRRHPCLHIAASADVSLCLVESSSFHAFGSRGVAGRDACGPVASAMSGARNGEFSFFKHASSTGSDGC